MATLEELQAVDTRARDLLREADLPQPDEVEYLDDEVVFKWHEAKAAAVFEATPR